MGDLTGIFIVGFIVLGLYKTFELLIRRKERLMFIDKLLIRCEQKEVSTSFQLPPISLNDKNNSSWPLRISLLLIGTGIGSLLSVFTLLVITAERINVNDDTRGFISFAYLAIFGGLGLLTSFLIELKQSKNK
jgi:hypothetical protein